MEGTQCEFPVPRLFRSTAQKSVGVTVLPRKMDAYIDFQIGWNAHPNSLQHSTCVWPDMYM